IHHGFVRGQPVILPRWRHRIVGGLRNSERPCHGRRGTALFERRVHYRRGFAGGNPAAGCVFVPTGGGKGRRGSCDRRHQGGGEGKGRRPLYQYFGNRART